MTKNNVLNLDMLDKAHKRFDKKRGIKIPVEIEGETQIAVLEIDEYFSPSKIRDCVEDFVNAMDAVRKVNNIYLDGVMESFIMYMVIKHFSNFPAPKDFSGHAKIVQKLSDTGLLFKIYAEFNTDEIAKIRKELEIANERLETSIDEMLGYIEEMGYKPEED